MTQPVPPGWYPDPPAPHTHVRWWDGQQWTELSQVVATGRFTEDGERLAGWWDRVGQYLLDSLLVDLVVGAAAAPYLVHEWPRISSAFQQMTEDSLDTGRSVGMTELMDLLGPVFLVLALISTTTVCLYGAVSLRWKGRTVGMAATGLRLRTVEQREGPLPWSVIARRLLAQQAGALLYVPLLLLGYGAVVLLGNLSSLYYLLDVLWPLWDRRSQTLHDKFAGTLLVRRY